MRPDSLIDERLCHEVRCFQDVGSNGKRIRIPAAWYAADGNDHWFTLISTKSSWLDGIHMEMNNPHLFRGHFGFKGSVPGVASLKKLATWKLGFESFFTFLVGMAFGWQVRTLSVGVCIHLSMLGVDDSGLCLVQAFNLLDQDGWEFQREVHWKSVP